MSSKLVKKGLEFVSSTSDSTTKQLKKVKRNKKQRQRNARYTTGIQKLKAKGKQKSQQDQDFTKQNLRYYTSSVWSMKKDTYQKIVENQDKRKAMQKDGEELEHKDDFE